MGKAIKKGDPAKTNIKGSVQGNFYRLKAAAFNIGGEEIYVASKTLRGLQGFCLENMCALDLDLVKDVVLADAAAVTEVPHG